MFSLLAAALWACLPDAPDEAPLYPDVVPGTPFAPVIEIRREHPDAETMKALLEELEIPDQGRVGIPPYPGARVISMTFYPQGDLERIDLLTPDAPEEVLEFYRTRLHDWTVAEASAAHHVILSPSDPDLRKALLFEAPSVQIRTPSKEFGDFDLMPQAGAAIWISYRPLGSD